MSNEDKNRYFFEREDTNIKKSATERMAAEMKQAYQTEPITAKSDWIYMLKITTIFFGIAILLPAVFIGIRSILGYTLESSIAIIIPTSLLLVLAISSYMAFSLRVGIGVFSASMSRNAWTNKSVDSSTAHKRDLFAFLSMGNILGGLFVVGLLNFIFFYILLGYQDLW
ncbi:MAG: hypothetical protein INQ03_08420 [Candidatus Heimdallarchaeota archaeon]|nr:hypothetical protein [Candidatus Heimdallarchaeota archaeon]